MALVDTVDTEFSTLYQPKSLWYVTEQVAADIDMANSKHFMKFFQWCIRGFVEMNKANVIPTTIKSATLFLNEHHEAYLPADYYDFIKVGVCCHGYLINFDRNDSICLERRDPCTDKEISCCFGENLNNAGNVNLWFWGNGWQWGYMPYQHNGQFTAGYYGRGEGFYHGGYRIDREKGIIKFDRCVRAEHVVLEYQSSGGVESGNAWITDDCIEALRHYVHWQRCMFAFDKAERVNMDYHRKRYQREVRRLVAKQNSVTSADFVALFRASISQLPKR